MNKTSKIDVPLCIDCDGTLLHTDLLHESILLLIKQAPLALLLLPFWLLRGKAYLKERIAERVQFDWSTLPYNQDVLKLIADGRADGRKIVLATASTQRWADGIAKYLDIFDVVVASGNGVNLSGERKARRLSEMYEKKQFDYAGNGSTDLPVWAESRLAIVVSSNARLVAKSRKVATVFKVIDVPRAGLMTFMKGLRIHQWIKNLLVLVPLLAAHKVSSVDVFLRSALAFLAFGFCASAVYVLNDLLDLDSDRQHIRKRNRPFASGIIPIWQGCALVPLLLGASVKGGDWHLSPTYDMLPMLYAPVGGELVARSFAANRLQPGNATLAEWAQAKALAMVFWRAASLDARISSDFRAVAHSNFETLVQTDTRLS